MLQACSFRANCKNRSECVWCKEYSEYHPIDKKIKTPKQIEAIYQKKVAKKEQKQTTASKRGRANRQMGRRAEKDRRAIWESHGIYVSNVPMSGALKSSIVVKDTVIRMSSDNWVTLNDKIYYEEVKRSAKLKMLYRLLSVHECVHVKDFCYIFRDDAWWRFLNKVEPEVFDLVDSKFKLLHKWFEQDKADIVSCVDAHLPWITCITEETYQELLR